MSEIAGKESQYIVSCPGTGSDPPFGSDREFGRDSEPIVIQIGQDFQSLEDRP